MEYRSFSNQDEAKEYFAQPQNKKANKQMNIKKYQIINLLGSVGLVIAFVVFGLMLATAISGNLMPLLVTSLIIAIITITFYFLDRASIKRGFKRDKEALRPLMFAKILCIILPFFMNAMYIYFGLNEWVRNYGSGDSASHSAEIFVISVCAMMGVFLFYGICSVVSFLRNRADEIIKK